MVASALQITQYSSVSLIFTWSTSFQVVDAYTIKKKQHYFANIEKQTAPQESTLSRFGLNGHTLVFHPRDEKL